MLLLLPLELDRYERTQCNVILFILCYSSSTIIITRDKMDQAYYTNNEIWPHLTVAEVRRSHIITTSASSTNEILDLCTNWKLELTLSSEVGPLCRGRTAAATSVNWDMRRGVLLLRGFQVPLIRFLWRLYTRVDDGAIAQVSTTQWSGGAHRRLVLGLLRRDLFNRLGPANNFSMDFDF